MAQLLEALGAPQRAYPVFHIAGTNGKGSTVATLDALLRAHGLRVARYTSPHLVDFAERIVVDGRPMAHDAITAWLTEREPLLTSLGATFFEATTAMAFCHFAAAKADVAIVEVGLGGRLDATNLVDPVAAAVTQIGFDHMEYLGDTLERIAGEKSGIFKAGRPAVIGDTRPSIRALLQRHAEHVGATPILVNGRDWTVQDVRLSAAGTAFTLTGAAGAVAYQTPLVGAFQAHNCAVALAMLEGAGGRWRDVLTAAPSALSGVRLAGRFHRAGRWLFDVAHNADGAATVVANLEAIGAVRPVVAVVSVLRDKDWRGMLQTLAAAVDRLILTNTPTAPASRLWPLDEVVAWAQSAGIPVEPVPVFAEALHRAEAHTPAHAPAHARAQGATILVTGSFHTVGDAMQRLQVDPLAR